MLKLKRIFSVGLAAALVAAVGLFVTSCVEPVDKYSVEIYGGGTDASPRTNYEEGDLVTIYAGKASPDKVFYQWTSDTVSEVVFTNPFSATTTFTMPAMNVAVRANWKDADPDTTIPPPVDTYLATIAVGESTLTVDYEAGDTVELVAEATSDELSFVKWVAKDPVTRKSVTVVFGDGEGVTPETYFIMPAKDIWIGAYYSELEYNAKVMYTWEAAEQSNISSIAASYNDVKFWYDNIFMIGAYVEEDASAIPIDSGSALIPDNIYSTTIGTTTYKGKYLPIDEGDYTAICTVVDPEFGDTTDIVANYTIEMDTTEVYKEKTFFEIAFDVGTYLAAEGTPWFDEARDNPFIGPSLVKAPAKKLVKKIVKDNVTYYVLHRVTKKK